MYQESVAPYIPHEHSHPSKEWDLGPLALWRPWPALKAHLMLRNIHSGPLSLLKAFLGLQATFHLMGKPGRGGLLSMTRGLRWRGLSAPH